MPRGVVEPGAHDVAVIGADIQAFADLACRERPIRPVIVEVVAAARGLDDEGIQHVAEQAETLGALQPLPAALHVDIDHDQIVRQHADIEVLHQFVTDRTTCV